MANMWKGIWDTGEKNHGDMKQVDIGDMNLFAF